MEPQPLDFDLKPQRNRSVLTDRDQLRVSRVRFEEAPRFLQRACHACSQILRMQPVQQKQAADEFIAVRIFG